MKKAILLTLFCFSATLNFAQTNETIVEVIGVGKVLAQPDKGVVQMSLTTVQMDFGVTIDSLNSKRSRLYDQLKELGFNENDIKSREYGIRENEIWSRNRPRYDSGFIGTQTLLLEFDNNEKTIAELIKSFSKSTVDVRLNFYFKLSDDQKQNLKAKVIEIAIDDANHKAQIIAKKSGRKLGEMLEISFGNVSNNITYIHDDFEEMIEIPMSNQPPQFNIGFAVQEMTLSDKILIKYRLK
jgi:uncharacterized protein YggE